MSSAAAAEFSTKFTRTETTSVLITQDYSNENARAGNLNLSTRSNNYGGLHHVLVVVARTARHSKNTIHDTVATMQN